MSAELPFAASGPDQDSITCDHPNCDRPATTHLTEMHDNPPVRDLHFCEQHAQEHLAKPPDSHTDRLPVEQLLRRALLVGFAFLVGGIVGSVIGFVAVRECLGFHIVWGIIAAFWTGPMCAIGFGYLAIHLAFLRPSSAQVILGTAKIVFNCLAVGAAVLWLAPWCTALATWSNDLIGWTAFVGQTTNLVTGYCLAAFIGLVAGQGLNEGLNRLFAHHRYRQ